MQTTALTHLFAVDHKVNLADGRVALGLAYLEDIIVEVEAAVFGAVLVRDGAAHLAEVAEVVGASVSTSLCCQATDETLKLMFKASSFERSVERLLVTSTIE